MLSYELSKQCTLIAVDEILEFMKQDDELHNDVHFANSTWIPYYEEVKQELQKL